jgi:hypothetical protein
VAGGPEGRRFGHIPTWVSAGAAAVSALVAAVALVLNAGDDGGSGAATASQRPAGTTATTDTVSAGDGEPFSGAGEPEDERRLDIETVSFVGPAADGPAYEFHGSAEVDENEVVRVLARPVVPSTSSEPAAAEEQWIVSAPAEVDDDGRWLARIGMPPLEGDSFDFAAVITVGLSGRTGGPPAIPLGTNPPATRTTCSLGESLEDDGLEYCGVVGTTAIERHDG